MIKSYDEGIYKYQVSSSRECGNNRAGIGQSMARYAEEWYQNCIEDILAEFLRNILVMYIMENSMPPRCPRHR